MVAESHTEVFRLPSLSGYLVPHIVRTHVAPRWRLCPKELCRVRAPHLAAPRAEANLPEAGGLHPIIRESIGAVGMAAPIAASLTSKGRTRDGRYRSHAASPASAKSAPRGFGQTRAKPPARFKADPLCHRPIAKSRFGLRTSTCAHRAILRIRTDGRADTG